MTRDEFEGVDIGRELRSARPRPSDEFVSRLLARIGDDLPVRRVSLRPMLALAATAAALVVAGAFGGISDAAYTVEHAVTSIVHIGNKVRVTHHGPGTPTQGTTSAPQAGNSGGQAQTGPGTATGGQTLAPPQGQAPTKPGDPAQSQYNPGCTPPPGLIHKPEVTCRWPPS